MVGSVVVSFVGGMFVRNARLCATLTNFCERSLQGIPGNVYFYQEVLIKKL